MVISTLAYFHIFKHKNLLMKLKKDLSELVNSDYEPLTEDQEGMLKGGFGTITVTVPETLDELTVNAYCPRNPKCTNDSCTINYCPTPTRPPVPPTAPPDSQSGTSTISIKIF